MRIAVLPLDSRPCNTQMIEEMIAWGGGECVLPRESEMDHFTRPAPFKGSRAFLTRELPQANAAVISLDHWCFGGLLGSREDKISREEALSRIQTLRKVLQTHPEKPIYLFSVILRSSLSTLCSEDLEAYHAMTEYSEHLAKYIRGGDPAEEEMARAARARIPRETLRKAEFVRNRNHAVNQAAIRLAGEGLLRSLSLLQEDTTREGMPKIEQETLMEMVRGSGTDRAFLRNGADEAGAVCAAQALWEATQGDRELPVAFRWVGQSDFTASYEDHPFQVNLRSMCDQMHIQEETDAETVVIIACPEGETQPEAPEVPVPEEHLRRIAEACDAEISNGKRVYLLDATRANGGALELPGMIRGIDRIWGYSAWNTSTNALGTLMAQVVTDHLRGAPNSGFLRERLMDDCLYQTQVRQEMSRELEKRGEDPYHLRNKAGAEEMLRKLFREEMRGRWPLREMPEYQVSLPWPRIFEMKAEAGGKREAEDHDEA